MLMEDSYSSRLRVSAPAIYQPMFSYMVGLFLTIRSSQKNLEGLPLTDPSEQQDSSKLLWHLVQLTRVTISARCGLLRTQGPMGIAACDEHGSKHITLPLIPNSIAKVSE